MSRIVSVSAAPYDGHPPPAVFDSLARCGATHVEPAFIVGYTDPFDDTAFAAPRAAEHAAWLAAADLACHALSAHIDLGAEGAVDAFRLRLDFAARIGARVVNTNAAVRAHETAFWRNIETLARDAEARRLLIGLENPGNAVPNVVDTAREGAELVARIGAPSVGLNADAGNTVSHRPEVDAVADVIAALPACTHLHLKAVQREPVGWSYPAIGEGDLDLAPLFAALGAWPTLAVSVETPIRMRRGPDAQPWRRVAAWPIEAVERCVRASLAAVAAADPARSRDP